eukprot:gnl/TRDRNA2_/TRDRNA2_188116_c0_seq1.p1 gnl/TRDRNA2_/TRDRNA2_188116_c0~~gnl/TRDRNA2_/TRDRNA2_188116_c0_seq1.p1  ORF type:complete len:318 (+),score=75.15 gnl/TRDRNA2_/TRDRNA2_188116_c0_seq1:90-1043(+)
MPSKKPQVHDGTKTGSACTKINDTETKLARAPSDEGNDFDIRMSEEPDGTEAAAKISKCIKKTGIALIEANAPHDLLSAAYDEAEELWKEGAFEPPLHVHDDRSMMEAKAWQQALSDEKKVFWIKGEKEGGSAPHHMCNALKLLAQNMADFGGGIGGLLKQDCGVEFDRHGHAMLCCYTGDRSYQLHLDNPHAVEAGDPMVDNGMRLTLRYYINPHWNPADAQCSGGLDFFLTDPSEAPKDSQSAKAAPVLRVAPHADTLLLFLSDRMAHQVLPTKGQAKWFCLTMWYFHGRTMDRVVHELDKLRRMAEKGDDSDDD